MQSFKISCHAPGAPPPMFSFFLLSRGNNTGRPSFSPGPNCFAFSCPPESLLSYYWLVFALWKGKHFQPYLRGTGISFIHVADLRMIVFQNAHRMAEISQMVEKLERLKRIEAHAQKQLAMVKIGFGLLLKDSQHEKPKYSAKAA